MAQGATPTLFCVRSSEKDSARLVRSVQVSIKTTRSAINPVVKEVLRVEQNTVDAAVETRRNGDIALTPRTPLPAGEYALVLVPPQENAAMWAWDFRVAQ